MADSESEIAPLSAERNALDWVLFGILTFMWASAYALTRVAVDKDNPTAGLPVEWVLSGRLTIGAIVLLGLMVAFGQRLPPLSDRRRWSYIAIMGVVGSVIPFYCITTAQQTVNSSLAALYTSAAPIFVAIGAHFIFNDERLSGRKVIGVLIGFCGVAVLFGPDALQGFSNASTVAQILLVVATMAYSASSLIARRAPPIPSIAFAAGFISVAAVITWPLALSVETADVSADWRNWAAVVALGAGPSAVGQALYMILVRRAGATFLSLTGYSIPIVSVGIGWVLFRETQEWNAIIAFALILSGVWLAKNSKRQSKASERPQ